MSDWDDSKPCSECGLLFLPGNARVRPRVTCSYACGAKRTARRRREEAEWMSRPALVETEEDRRYLEEFIRWAQSRLVRRPR